MAISGVGESGGLAAVNITPQQITPLSLDDRLRDAFASTSVATQAEYANIMGMANDAKYLSTPGGLFELQVHLGEYKQHVEVISALTRKGVAAAETLLRA
ncbi:type III secretion system inner rod subunit SctI [Solimicrobium silvestre]|nr:type III secretion system inner rod subunit SctI [Solimicrobium silvestre]